LFSLFFVTGLFTIGGGLAAIPILHSYLVVGGFISESAFVDMIAVSQSTPGPIGLNLATFIGFKSAGLLGAAFCVIGYMAPAYIISVLIIRFVHDYSHNRFVQASLANLRPAAVGLIASAVLFITCNAVIPTDNSSVISLPAVAVFAGIFLLRRYFKPSPVALILIGAVAGILFL
jgi:chromate transporter